MNSIVGADRSARKFLLWVPIAAVLLFCLVYALGFVSIYGQEHVYYSSSRWIYANIPAGSRIIGVHWDDSLPLTLPGYSANVFRSLGELPLYEADTPAKITAVSEKLARTDYLILPTQRLQGSITRVPLEFPYTTSLFRLLFSDQLGFRLIKTIKVRPAFLGFQFDDDLADESFSVYDHPKVSIFKNEQRLSAAQLRAEIMSPARTGTPSLAEIMKRNAD